ncbi:MAG: tagaturonate epimerase family protein [candidate division KSB1 bacterium]|nr:tagaturonate epimerase family protein [candidate division KSB1 bacterium]
MRLGKYSIGIGDRFGLEGEAQLAALQQALALGVEIIPVWNKSFREHSIIGSTPEQTRRAADAAVHARKWALPYFVDADHVGLKTVDLFIDACDFITLDVADFIGKPAAKETVESFVTAQRKRIGKVSMPEFDIVLDLSEERLRAAAAKYLCAVQEAGRIYRRIAERKRGEFVIEVSMDETETPQTPEELLVILAAIAEEDIPVQTIAPKFCGSFYKGIDYVGNALQFAYEFAASAAAVHYAAHHYNLPDNLKLSVHSGSDKFSLYPHIHRVLKKFNVGLHLKTAGTTWLEELIGLTTTPKGLRIVKSIYNAALERFDELIRPYAAVVNIDRRRLPNPAEVSSWDGRQFAEALRHDPHCPHFNPHLRQLLHVSFKIAAELGADFITAIEEHREIIHEKVKYNLFERHIKPLFID